MSRHVVKENHISPAKSLATDKDILLLLTIEFYNNGFLLVFLEVNFNYYSVFDFINYLEQLIVPNTLNLCVLVVYPGIIGLIPVPFNSMSMFVPGNIKNKLVLKRKMKIIRYKISQITRVSY